MSDLTVLLPVRDRVNFSVRWLKYANLISLPYSIVVADGGSNNDLEKAMASINLDNIDVNYVRFSFDETYGDYYNKIASAASEINTKYLVMADDDDFILVDSIRSSIQFLEKNEDYGSCGGQTVSFKVKCNIGNLLSGDCTYYGDEVVFYNHDRMRSLDDDSAVVRIDDMLDNYKPIYYNVYRAADISRYFSVLRDINPVNLPFSEIILAVLTVAGGKVKQLDGVSLLRQSNTTMSSNSEHVKRYGDQFDSFFMESWSNEFHGFIDAVLKEMKYTRYEFSDLEAKNSIIKSFKNYISPVVVRNISSSPQTCFSSKIRSKLKSIVPARIVGFVRRFYDTLFERSVSFNDESNSIIVVKEFLTK